MSEVYIAIGSNTGDIEKNLYEVIQRLKHIVKYMEISSCYRTTPYGIIDQPHFLNLVVKGKTNLSPQKLLLFLKNLEKEIGRQVRGRWCEREIDLDILLYDNFVIQKENLSIPHVDMQNRDFVLFPLLEISPKILDPRNNLPFKNYTNNLKIKTIIKKSRAVLLGT